LALVQQESSVGDDYVLGHSAEEYERLRHQAQALEPATKRIFQSIGLRAGSSCLDIGCGPGEVIRLMGEIVGPSGRVTGLDRDTRAGREAINRLQASGTSRYRLIEADMEDIRDIGGESFDLTFARLALLFTRDPVSVLRKMQLDEARRVHCYSGFSCPHNKYLSEARSLFGTLGDHSRNV
jgi:ubiquinone/menaquinone biosynthesis C-methylase UbiE